MATPPKPPVLPEVYTGEKNWDEWIDHFESVATVCGWDDAAKLKWLHVRLTGRAGSAFRRLPTATKADYGATTEALKERFEPASKKELYMTSLNTRMKKRSEDWAVYGEDLKLLADKAYPDLQEAAREQFALNQFLTQLDNAQVAFAVKQAKPRTVDDAIRLTMEMESYLRPSRPAKVTFKEENDRDREVETVAAAGAARPTTDATMQLVLQRMERLETELQSCRKARQEPAGPTKQRRWARPPKCWNCEEEGHIARYCTAPPRKPRDSQDQGNEKPSGP